MILRRRIVLTFIAPILTRATAAGGFGIDAPLARLPNGKFYLPGTLVLGRIAEALRHLAQAQEAACQPATCGDVLAEFFGDNGDEARGRDKRRRIFVGDCVTSEEGDPSNLRTRIALDSVSGAVQEGALQTIESPFAPGKRVKFEGELRLLGTKKAINGALPLIEKAMAWMTQLGALRTAGFGVIDSVRLCDPDPLNASGEITNASDRLALTLRMRDPLFVGDKRIDENTYESAALIPGGAIKGALANQILADAGLPAGKALQEEAERLPETLRALARHFSDITVTHGYPILKGQTSNPLARRAPLSWIESGAEGLADLASIADPAMAVLIDGKAPRFALAGKNPGRAHKAAGWSKPPEFDFRIRTAIDETRRAAKENKLFGVAYRRTDQHYWRSEIDLSALRSEDLKKEVIAGLAEALREGLIGLGRGGAFCEASLAATSALSCLGAAGRFALVLQTQALLRKPEAGRGGDVTEAYREAFGNTGLPASFDLLAIFVWEELRGAAFMSKRLPSGVRYRPWLLTKPGSVFVFGPATENAAPTAEDFEVINSWLRSGLPVPKATLTYYGITDAGEAWRFCPYLPQNGYGEVMAGTDFGGVCRPVEDRLTYIGDFGFERQGAEVA